MGSDWGWKTRDSSKASGQDYLRMAKNDAHTCGLRPVVAGDDAEFLTEGVQPLDPIRRPHDARRGANGDGTRRSAKVSRPRHWCASSDRGPRDQSRRILQLLRSRPALTPQASLTLANLYHRLKQDGDARGEVLRACALLRTVGQYTDLENKIRNLAKQLGDEKLVEKPIEPRVLEELGFLGLKSGVPIPAREVGGRGAGPLLCHNVQGFAKDDLAAGHQEHFRRHRWLTKWPTSIRTNMAVPGVAAEWLTASRWTMDTVSPSPWIDWAPPNGFDCTRSGRTADDKKRPHSACLWAIADTSHCRATKAYRSRHGEIGRNDEPRSSCRSPVPAVQHGCDRA